MSDGENPETSDRSAGAEPLGAGRASGSGAASGSAGPIEIASPNHGPRKGVAAPNMILLHYTGMPSAALALARLCSPAAEVSAHYLIDEEGQVFRLVSEMRRAWHAGVGAWGAVEDVNSHSIGVELVNPGPEGGLPPFPEPQMQALERLLFDMRLRWSIPPERVLGHSDVAVGRKIDPGPRFDWARLAARGHAIWSDLETPETPSALPPETLLGVHALKLGYRWAEGEQGFADLIQALQLRFAPDEQGAPVSPRLAARVAQMAERHPVIDGQGRRSAYAPAPMSSGRAHAQAPRPEAPDAPYDFGPDFDLDTE